MIRRDWRFSEDGDLELGSHKMDQEGNRLYIDITGELSINPEEGKPLQDIALTSQRNVIKQVIINRLKTDAPDWLYHPEMGGNLSDLIGEPNTRETALRGVQYIQDALSYANYFSREVIKVRPVPVSNNSILFYIEIVDSNGLNIEYPMLFNLEHGIVNRYENEQE